MDDVVVGRIAQHPVHPLEGIGEDLSSLFIERGFHVLETGVMGFGKNPCLEWKTGGKGGDGEKGLIFADDPFFLLKLLSDDITEDAPIFILEIDFGPFDLLGHPPWNDRKGNDLRGGSILIAFTKRTETTYRSSFLCYEIGGSPSSLCRNDHPPSMDRVFSQFGHDGSSFD